MTSDGGHAPSHDASAVPIVGIGASAGGLEALREMFTPASAPTGMAFVVVQHLDPHHESMMAQLLDRHTELAVRQCEGGETIQADTVYIIPPGHGLAIEGGRLELTNFAQPRGLRRPIDDFFVSLASDQNSNAACVILSGTGADGTTGLRAVKEHGGVCVVQQPETAKYDGMPVSAVGTGLVDFVKAPGEILGCLASFFNRRGTDVTEEQAEFVADHIDELCKVLRNTIGHDFSGYKRTTLVRRVERRMHVLGIDTGRSYLKRITSDKGECDALFRDLLINVTRFFRDGAHFEALREKVIEPLCREGEPGDEIRVWVPGCSSGEEAYTIAMMFAEVAATLGQPPRVQVFATDIDEQMLAIARDGSYPLSAMVDIPLALREKYTVPHVDRFTVTSQIRDLIRFSNHSLVKDPPFSRIDLVSCRNLMIYFDDRLQQSVLPLLHYAIRPGGYLFLGPSESVGRFDNLFPPLDQQARIFERSPGSPSYPIDLPGSLRESGPNRRARHLSDEPRALADEGAAVNRLIERYVPPALVVDGDGAILAAYGRLSRYFEFPVSRAGGTSAISLARPGLRAVLGPLIRQTKQNRRRSVVRDIEVATEYGVVATEVVCDPLADGTLLCVFLESGPFRPTQDIDELASEDGDDHVEALESELRLTRHRLRTTVEELETANEELKSSNEEMMSMNEELQSTNEELSTVNDELKSKVDQLTVANSDLRNFFESTSLGVVVLDEQLRLRSFTKAATNVFPLQQSDRGRPFADVSTRLASNDYLDDAVRVAATGEPIHRRVYTRDGERTLALRTLPYRLQDGRVEGVTLVLTDVTEALALERQLASERERLDMAIKAGGIGVWEYFPETGETVLDETEKALFGETAERVPLKPLMDRVVEEDRAELQGKLARAADGSEDFEATFRIVTDAGVRRWVKGFGRLVAGSSPTRIVGVSIDVTPEYMLSETRELLLREMNHRVKNLFAMIAGMIRVAARKHDSIGSLTEDLGERITALGRAHSLSSHAASEPSADLRDLIEVTIAPYRSHAQVQVSGPRVLIQADHISPVALIIHEWATNCVKHGVLGDEDGNLLIEWILKDGQLAIDWVEMRKKPLVESGRSGFGTILVETSARQLGASIGTALDGLALRQRLEMPYQADDDE